MHLPVSPVLSTREALTRTMRSYDAFKIFMGLPTTGGPVEEQKRG